MRPLLVALMLAAVALAGCSGGAGEPAPTPTTATTQPPLEAGKGAIMGLVINDLYRPVDGAVVLLQPVGLTAATDASGQFAFTGLDPGAYVARVSKQGHAATPRSVEVKEGEYAELEIRADRLLNQGTRIVTNQFSIFIPCAVSAVAVTGTHGYCFYDDSGESYRPGLQDLNYTAFQNVTYLVAEVLLNQPDNYEFVIRHDNGDAFGGEEYGSGRTEGGAYAKIVLRLNDNHLKQTQPGNANWTNDKPLAALVFYLGAGGEELETAGCVASVPVPGTPATNPTNTCRDYFGAGHKFAIEGDIVLSLFLGEPDMPIEGYGVLKPG